MRILSMVKFSFVRKFLRAEMNSKFLGWPQSIIVFEGPAPKKNTLVPQRVKAVGLWPGRYQIRGVSC